MSDSCSGFTRDRFLSCLKEYGPALSIHEVAALCKVSIRQALCVSHHHPWDIEQHAGERGWLYRKRIAMLKSVKIADPSPREYVDQGISKRSPKAVRNA